MKQLTYLTLIVLSLNLTQSYIIHESNSKMLKVNTWKQDHIGFIGVTKQLLSIPRSRTSFERWEHDRGLHDCGFASNNSLATSIA